MTTIVLTEWQRAIAFTSGLALLCAIWLLSAAVHVKREWTPEDGIIAVVCFVACLYSVIAAFYLAFGGGS